MILLQYAYERTVVRVRHGLADKKKPAPCNETFFGVYYSGINLNLSGICAIGELII